MRRVAIGIRMHSGWGTLVAVVRGKGADSIIERKRLAVISPDDSRAKQPYHFARTLAIAEAEKFIRDSFAISERYAVAALRELIAELAQRRYQVAASAVMMASGRALPDLARILDSHPLIHTAEGEFFRAVFCRACERLGLPVLGFRERDLQECVRFVFGEDAPRLRSHISTMGRSIGPPWTSDHKAAATGALIALSGKQRALNIYSVPLTFQHLNPPLLK